MYSTCGQKAGWVEGHEIQHVESLKKSTEISLTGEVQIGHLDQPTAESVATAVVRSLNVMY